MNRKMIFTVLMLLVMALAACTSTAQPAVEAPMDESSESMDDESMADDMQDDDMDSEEASSDDAMVDMDPVTFVVRIENVGAADGLTVLAPGTYELNTHPVAFFTPGEADRGAGLEALAEDGNPAALVESINNMMSADMGGFSIGVFNTPVGAAEPGPAAPGSAYKFRVDAYAGQYLTFATMFVQSNDWFFAPGPDGIALFDADGNPISGDITSQVFLWNAGTEVDQVPGEGADQAPRQSGPDTGEAENGVVSLGRRLFIQSVTSSGEDPGRENL